MQIQINCPYFRTSTYINNGVQQQVHVCGDQGCPVDHIEFCIGSKCRFVNIDQAVDKPSEEVKQEIKEEALV